MDEDELLGKLEKGDAFVIAELRKCILQESNDSFPRLFAHWFKTCLNQFCVVVSKDHPDLPLLSETKRLGQLLEIHLKVCQVDEIFAHELACEGSHMQLLRIIQSPMLGEPICERNQDIVMELQDIACSIAATYDSFPMRVTPFTLEELQERLPLSFLIAPVKEDDNPCDDVVENDRINTSKNQLPTESILIHQVAKRQSAQEDVGFGMSQYACEWFG